MFFSLAVIPVLCATWGSHSCVAEDFKSCGI